MQPDQLTECADFLTTIWGTDNQDLYRLITVQLHPERAADHGDTWKTFGFRKARAIDLALKRIVEAEESGANVYFCPALFTKPLRKSEFFAGSHTLWMDSDGNAPMSFDGPVPAPSIRVRTSSPTNIHDYWLLDEFVTDIETIETGNRSITSFYGTDASGWDAPQLLRPPGTTNRKNGLPVRVLS